MISFCTAGSVGVRIVISAGGFSLVGSTCTLLAEPGNYTSPESNQTVGNAFAPLTVTADGLSAYYTTTGSDFIVAGPWTLWLKVVTPSEQTLLSQPGLVYVYPAPALIAA